MNSDAATASIAIPSTVTGVTKMKTNFLFEGGN